MIDRNLNYGRHIIKTFCEESRPYDVVLDIAAGKGNDLDIARQVCPDAHVMALECHKPSIDYLKLKDIDVFDADIERDRFPVEDRSIDIVIANQILEHTKELFWIFHEISRAVKVRGKLIIGVPNLASLHNRILLMLGRQPSPIKSNSAHIRGFTKGDIIKFLDCWGGYELLDFQGSNFYPFPPIVAKPLARRFPSMAWGIFLLFEKVRVYNGSFLRYPREQGLETNFYLGKD
ncbi:MAG: class I SAM-dependent methyltransferase [Thermodesulfobacteriota bacterium]|nr:class I SAM-dependent methyltransferase [Thermodesulfobacteriota bacterium]